MTNPVKKYFDNKKLKKEILRLQDDFRSEKEKALKRTPSPLAKQGEALAKEWQDRYIAAQVKGKSRQDTIGELNKLVLEVKAWQQVPVQDVPQEQPPQTLTEGALRLLLKQAQGVALALSKVNAPCPRAVTAALEAGQTTIDQWNNQAKEVRNATAVGLQQVLRMADALQGFAQAWQSGDEQDARALRSLPPRSAPQILTAQRDAWSSPRQEIGTALEGAALEDVAKITTLGTLLRQAAAGATRTRTRLLDEALAVEQLRLKASADLEEARIPPVLGLTVAELAYQRGVQQLSDATSLQGLQSAREALDSVAQHIVDARNNFKGNEPKLRDALERYRSLHAKALQMMSKAQKLRGASDPLSEVHAVIKPYLTQLKEAEEAVRVATSTVPIEEATKKLQEILKSNFVEVAQKQSKKDKKQTEKDLEALPEFQKALDELRTIRAAVAECFGAHKELEALDQLLGGCAILGNGRPQGGFDGALQRIRAAQPQKVLLEARKKNENFEKKPEGIQDVGSFHQTLEALNTYGTCHTPYDLALKRQALVDLTATPGSEAALVLFLQSLKQDVHRQKQRQGELEEKRKAQAQALETLRNLGKPPGDPDLVMLHKRLEDTGSMLNSWRLDEAQTELNTLDELTSAQVDLYQTALDEFKKLTPQLEELVKTAQPWTASWGGAKMLAASVVKDVPALIEQSKNGLLDPVEALRRAKVFLGRVQVQLTDAISACGLDGNAQRLDGLEAKRSELDKRWTQAAASLRQKIQALHDPLVKAGVTGGVQSMGWPSALDALVSQWETMQYGLKAQGEETAAQALQREFDALSNQLLLLQQQLPDPQKVNEQKFTDSVEEGKQAESKAQWRRIHAKAAELLHEIQADAQYQSEVGKASKLPLPEGIKPIDRVSDALGGSFDTIVPDAQKAEQWRVMAELMARWVVQRRQEIRSEKAPLKNEAEQLKKDVKLRLGDRQKVRFRGLFEDLSLRLDDALLMLESDDVSLVKAAEKDITAIRLMLADAKGKGGKGAVTLSRLEKRLSELSHLLGDGYHVQKRMPVTYARLKPQLDNAWQTAKKVGPEEGMKLLENLQAPITQARKEAKELTLRYEAFKLQRKAVEELHEKVKTHTETTLGNRTQAYNERLKSRLDEAHGLARQEGRLTDGFQALKVIEDELNRWLAQPKDQARAELLQAEAEAENDQRELRDLARSWNARQDYWDEQGLPAVEKAMKRRGEDLQEYESLKAAILNIGKTLTPYLDVVSAVPHKRGLSNGAPDMPTARAAFSQASLRLAQLEKVAQRLLEGKQSTNVTLDEDFQALAQEWKLRTEKVAADLAAVTLELKQLPAQAIVLEEVQGGNGGQQQQIPANALSRQAIGALNTALKSVEDGLRTLSTRFPADSFDKPFVTLQAKDSEAAARRKAREEVLRAVNVLAADLVGNPLLVGLFDGAQRGLLQRDPRPSLGLLRATMKKIELAALVGV